MTIPYTFASQAGPIPTNELDANFSYLNTFYGNFNTSRGVVVTDYPYNCDPTGVLDSTAGFAAALVAGSGTSVFVPAGTYRINGALTVPTSTFFYGVGLGSSIVQYASNVPILNLVGTATKTKCSDLQLSYNSPQPVTNTGAFAINLQDFNECSLDHIFINNCFTGIYCGPNSGVSTATVYSSTISNIRVEDYSGYGIYLSSLNANNSGNVLINIYIVNTGLAAAVLGGAYFANWNDGVVNQLNIEQCYPSNPPLVIAGCDNLTINALHFETVQVTLDYSGMISLSGSRASITGLTVTNCTYTTTNIASLVYLGGAAYVAGGQVILQNVMERGNTVTTASAGAFYSSSTSSNARLIGYTLSAFGASFLGGQGTFLQNNNTFSNVVENIINLTYSPTIATDASQAATFSITATNGTAFTISSPTNNTTGDVITYRIRNNSGGALGTLTWGTAFKLASWTQPATGFSRTITFGYDGTNWIEQTRTTVDVPN